MFLKLLRFLSGTVTFTAKGGFLARFVNLCHLHRIPIRNMRKQDGAFVAETSVKGYKKIRQPAKKSAVRVRAVKKNGLPFLLKRNRIRVGLAVGAALAVLLYSLASSCFWRIEVDGNVTLPAVQILHCAAQAGLERGMWKKNLDAGGTEKYIMDSLEQIQWIAVNTKGCTVQINIKEKTAAPDVDIDNTPCNVVASRDGYIQQLHILRGRPVAQNLTAVSCGELLISGEIIKKDEETYTVHAKGECIARTNRKLLAAADLSAYQQITSLEKKRSFYFFGLALKPGNTGSLAAEGEKDLSAGGVLLPVGIQYRYAFSREKTAGSLSREQKNLLSCAEMYAAYSALKDSVEIVSEQFSYQNGDSDSLVYEAVCLEDIAMETPLVFDVSENPDILE